MRLFMAIIFGLLVAMPAGSMGEGALTPPGLRRAVLSFGVNQASADDNCMRAAQNANGNDTACTAPLTLGLVPSIGSTPVITSVSCMITEQGLHAGGEQTAFRPEFVYSNDPDGDGSAFDIPEVATGAAIVFDDTHDEPGDWMESGSISVASSYTGVQSIQIRIDDTAALSTPGALCTVVVVW